MARLRRMVNAKEYELRNDRPKVLATMVWQTSAQLKSRSVDGEVSSSTTDDPTSPPCDHEFMKTQLQPTQSSTKPQPKTASIREVLSRFENDQVPRKPGFFDFALTALLLLIALALIFLDERLVDDRVFEAIFSIPAILVIPWRRQVPLAALAGGALALLARYVTPFVASNVYWGLVVTLQISLFVLVIAMARWAKPGRAVAGTAIFAAGAFWFVASDPLPLPRSNWELFLAITPLSLIHI